jgi:hypothetical protein
MWKYLRVFLLWILTDGKESAPAGDCTSTHPDIYSSAPIKTNNALLDFSAKPFSIFFIVMR